MKRDLDLATNGRGLAEAMETLSLLSDSANNVFRFEHHAHELSALSNQIEALNGELQAAQDILSQTEIKLQASREEFINSQSRVLQLENDLHAKFSANEEFSLIAQTSKSFFEATQTVGLVDVFASFVSVITPSGQDNLSTGEVATWRTDHTTCRLTLASIDNASDQARFLLSCT